MRNNPDDPVFAYGAYLFDDEEEEKDRITKAKIGMVISNVIVVGGIIALAWYVTTIAQETIDVQNGFAIGLVVGVYLMLWMLAIIRIMDGRKKCKKVE